ncbi:hypothetical protein V6N13_100482 [Hibiscus sabdariffa]
MESPNSPPDSSSFAIRETATLHKKMASLDPSNSPPNHSFALRDSTAQCFLRSLSTKETSFNGFHCSPPRYSTPSLHTSPLSSPLRAVNPAPANHTISLDASYKCLSSVLKKDGQILSIAISNGIIYTGSDSNLIRIWKLPEFSECGVLKTKASTVVALAVSHERVFAAYGDTKIRVWRTTWDGTLKHIKLATIPRTSGYVRSYISGKDKMMRHMGPITSLAINISDNILYSASVDKTVKVWRISDLKCIENIPAHSEPINAIVVADDGILYTASDDATVRVWRRNFCRGEWPHSLTVTLPAKCSPVKTLTLTADGGVLYGGCTDGYVHYWLKGWLSGQLQYGGALRGHTHAVMCLASVSNYVVSGSADSSCRVWSREHDGQHVCLAVLVGHRGPIRCVTAYLGHSGDEVEDGCTICSGSLDGVLKIWRVNLRVRPASLHKPFCSSFNIAVSLTVRVSASKMALRGVWQLKKLIVSYCDWGGSSRGIRAFMETELPTFKEKNPQLEVVTELIRGQHPHLKGFYKNKNERVVCVKNLTTEDILLHATRLRNALGRKVVKLKTRHVTKHPSVQGTWTTDVKF